LDCNIHFRRLSTRCLPPFRLRGTIVRPDEYAISCQSTPLAYSYRENGRKQRENGRERDNDKSRCSLGKSRTIGQNEPLALLLRTQDGLDRRALPVLPSPADPPRAALQRDDHDRRGDPWRPFAASGL